MRINTNFIGQVVRQVGAKGKDGNHQNKREFQVTHQRHSNDRNQTNQKISLVQANSCHERLWQVGTDTHERYQAHKCNVFGHA